MKTTKKLFTPIFEGCSRSTARSDYHNQAIKCIIENKLVISTAQYGTNGPNNKLNLIKIYDPYNGLIEKKFHKIPKSGPSATFYTESDFTSISGSINNYINAEKLDPIKKFLKLNMRTHKANLKDLRIAITFLQKVQKSWELSEIKSGDLGHLYKYNLSDLNKNLTKYEKKLAIHFKEIIKMNVLLYRHHFVDYPSIPSGPKFYDVYDEGPNPFFNQIENNGAIGVSVSNATPKSFYTPIGELDILGSQESNPKLIASIVSIFKAAKEVNPNNFIFSNAQALKHITPPYCLSLGKNTQGAELNQVIFKKSANYSLYDDCEETWKNIRDYAFHLASVELKKQ